MHLCWKVVGLSHITQKCLLWRILPLTLALGWGLGLGWAVCGQSALHVADNKNKLKV